MRIYDVVIIGGGQAGLSIGYFLRRTKLDWLILDENEKPGGAWLQTWDNLKLFSPTDYNSLSGWPMPKSKREYPTKDEFIDYLKAYEKRYNFPINRPVKVLKVEKENDLFKVTTNGKTYFSKTLISATGTANNPYIPNYPNQDLFKGKQLHSVNYRNPKSFSKQKVLVVGGGNSGAQILAELSKVANTTWVTKKEPVFLPDAIDGRYLFKEANKIYKGEKSKQISLDNIVMVENVKKARDRGDLKSVRPFTSFYEKGVVWPNKTQENFDAVIWCTGFKSNLKHLKNLNLLQNGRIKTKKTRSLLEPNLWLVGYGNWTGFASATIYGVGKTARETVKEIKQEFGV